MDREKRDQLQEAIDAWDAMPEKPGRRDKEMVRWSIAMTLVREGVSLDGDVGGVNMGLLVHPFLKIFGFDKVRGPTYKLCVDGYEEIDDKDMTPEEYEEYLAQYALRIPWPLFMEVQRIVSNNAMFDLAMEKGKAP